MQRFFFKENFPGTLVIPNTKGGDTIIRVYPQFTSDGGTLPAITRFVEVGEDRIPELSNLEMAYTTMGQGHQETQRFTGLVIPLEWDNTTRSRPQLDSPVSGLYVKLKGLANKHELTPVQQAELTRLTAGNPKGNPPTYGQLSSPEETYFVSCMIVQVAGVAQKPDAKGVLILRGAAATVYCQAVKRAWERAEAAHAADPTKPFVDPFSIAGGVCFTFSVLPADPIQGRQKPVISCVAGIKGFNGTNTFPELEAQAVSAPIKDEVARANYIDVNQWYQRHTWEQLMAAALKMYGRIAVQAGIPTQLEEYETLLASRQAIGGTTQAAVVPAAVQAVVQAAAALPVTAQPAATPVQTVVTPAVSTTPAVVTTAQAVKPAPAAATTGAVSVDSLLAELASLEG